MRDYLAVSRRRLVTGFARIACPSSRLPEDSYRGPSPERTARDCIQRVCVAAVLACVAALGALLGPVSGAAADSCPNAAFRVGPSAYLPDCRAYEMVTPPFKDGFEVEPSMFLPDGSSVVGASIGAFSGAIAAGFVTDYKFAREGLGWTTTPLDAPSSQFGSSNSSGQPTVPIGTVGTALLPLHPASGSIYDARFYLRKPGGSLTLVGPTLPPSAIPPTPTGTGEGQMGEGIPPAVGATPDLSHVLFTLRHLTPGSLPPGITNNLWPGDTTAVDGRSLYEYVGTGNSTPALVGVSGGAGSSSLISQCGTYLGGNNGEGNNGEGNTHNALSADGSTAFFTATGADHSNCGGTQPPVDELFARINQSQTIAISEPSPNDGCTTPSCTGASPGDAVFQGASADGSRVFFMTQQPLLDSDTDNGTDLYLYNFNAPVGQRIIQVSGGGAGDPTPGSGAQVQGVAAVAEDGSHVYFVARGVLTTTPNSQGRVANAGADNLYLYERDAQFPSGRTVFIGALASSDPAQWSPGGLSPMNVTADGRFLVFTNTADLTAEDTSTAQQVFRYDALTNQLVRISIGDNGFNNNGNTSINFTFIARPSFQSYMTVNQDAHPSVSEDGSIVVFVSSSALTPRALDDPTNNVFNVYEYHDGHVYLISDGRDSIAQGSLLIGISATGSDVFFTTHDSLAPQDGDTLNDIYDARIDGGFPAPASPVGCGGDACQGPLSATPPNQTPGSASFQAPGNPTPNPTSSPKPRKCRRGFVKKRGRCGVGKLKRKKAQRTNRNRGGHR